MLRDIRIKFIAIVILAMFAAYIVAPIPNKPRALSGFRINPGMDLAGGAELRYKVLYEPAFTGDKREATKEAADVLRRRIEARQLQEPKINSYGEDGIIIQLAGVDEDGLRDYKSLFRTTGNLELYAAASEDFQERYAKDKVVPDGYKVVENREHRDLLIEKHPVIEGRHILNAEPQQELQPGGSRWVTSFELDAEGAKRFDEAAAKLFAQHPRGRLVILLDGQVQSTPVVESPAFHGRGQISGAKR